MVLIRFYGELMYLAQEHIQSSEQGHCVPILFLPFSWMYPIDSIKFVLDLNFQ